MNRIRTGLTAGIAAGLMLVAAGKALVPSANWLSVGAAGSILVIYGAVLWMGSGRLSPTALRSALIFGLAAGAVFAVEILLEYLLLPADNTRWGLIEFGTVFLLYFLCGLWTAFQSGGIKDGSSAAAGAAMLSSLIWFITLLAVFLLFLHSPRQTQVLRAEGTFEDFARSGMTDLDAFVMEDLFGAGFFHLLLGPLFGLILGTAGAWTGRLLTGFKNKRRNP